MVVTGVGKVSAAVAVTRALSSGPLPSEIINIGTAGALKPGLSGTHFISQVVQHDFDSPGIEALTGYRGGAPITLGGQGPVLATGDIFVSDPAVRSLLAQRADLVDMEAYAVASAAAAFGIPVRIIKHVSDEADAGAFRTWQESVDACARALAAFVACSWK